MDIKSVRLVVSLSLLVAFLAGSFLMLAPIDEADAWLRHACNCVETITIGLPPKVEIKCDVTYHWHIFDHEWTCP